MSKAPVRGTGAGVHVHSTDSETPGRAFQPRGLPEYKPMVAWESARMVARPQYQVIGFRYDRQFFVIPAYRHLRSNSEHAFQEPLSISTPTG